MKFRVFSFLMAFGVIGCEQAYQLNSSSDDSTSADIEGVEVIVPNGADPVAVTEQGSPIVLISKKDPNKKYCETGELKKRNLSPSSPTSLQLKDSKQRKVLLCKVPPGNPENKHQIMIAEKAAQAHLKNGSYLGLCDGKETDETSIDKCDKYIECPVEDQEL